MGLGSILETSTACAILRLAGTAAQPSVSKSTEAIAILKSHAANMDCLLAAGIVRRAVWAWVGTDGPGRAVGIVGFSRSGSRSRSEITSRITSRSMVFLFSAHPNDRALKQRLLMLRGMPSLCSAIRLRAFAVNKEGLSHPPIQSLWSM